MNDYHKMRGVSNELPNRIIFSRRMQKHFIYGYKQNQRMFTDRQIIRPLCRKIKVQEDDIYNNLSYDDYAVEELCEILEKRILINEETDYSKKRICSKSSDYQFNYQTFLRASEPNFVIQDEADKKIEYSNESISTCKIVPDIDCLSIFVEEINFMEQTSIIQQNFNRKLKQCDNGGVKKKICKQKYSRTNQ